jgi:hypothetical protein
VLRGRVLIYSQLIELNFLSRDFFQVFGTLEEARPTWQPFKKIANGRKKR